MDKFAEEWEKQINKYFNKKQEREKQRIAKEEVGLTFTPRLDQKSQKIASKSRSTTKSPLKVADRLGQWQYDQEKRLAYLQKNNEPIFRPMLKANFVQADQKRKEAFDLSMTLQTSVERPFTQRALDESSILKSPVKQKSSNQGSPERHHEQVKHPQY